MKCNHWYGHRQRGTYFCGETNVTPVLPKKSRQVTQILSCSGSSTSSQNSHCQYADWTHNMTLDLPLVCLLRRIPGKVHSAPGFLMMIKSYIGRPKCDDSISQPNDPLVNVSAVCSVRPAKRPGATKIASGGSEVCLPQLRRKTRGAGCCSLLLINRR